VTPARSNHSQHDHHRVGISAALYDLIALRCIELVGAVCPLDAQTDSGNSGFHRSIGGLAKE